MEIPAYTLKTIEDEISAKYKELAFTQGFSFLYTDIETYNPQQDFMFIGLNPGGKYIVKGEKGYGCHIACAEGENAYLDEDWIGKDGREGQAALQIQLKEFFKSLCQKMGITDWEKHMRGSLCLNFIPFRSSNWNTLDKKKDVRQFSHHLWTNILRYIHPRAILCIDNYTRASLHEILINDGWKCDRSINNKIGWGNDYYYLDYFSKGSSKLLIAKFPHLSSRKIFSRENCAEPRNLVITEIAGAIQSHAGN